jgi:hypothetical protein
MTIAGTIASRGWFSLTDDEKSAVVYTVGLPFKGMRFAFKDGSAGFRPWATAEFEDLGVPSEEAVAYWAALAPTP